MHFGENSQNCNFGFSNLITYYFRKYRKIMFEFFVSVLDSGMPWLGEIELVCFGSLRVIIQIVFGDPSEAGQRIRGFCLRTQARCTFRKL